MPLPHVFSACHRNFEEMTITERLLKRDYICKLEYRPCIVGEDKSNPSQQQVCVSFHSCPSGPKQPANSKNLSCVQEAVQDAVDKYRTVNAVIYGRLGYILMVTMAGSWMAVHGMPLIANLQTKDLIPLIRPFEVGCSGICLLCYSGHLHSDVANEHRSAV